MPKIVKPTQKSTAWPRTRSYPNSITGRDRYIMAKALAYAIETIEALPERWQEESDCQDMKMIFEVMFDAWMRQTVTYSARLHLFQEGGVTVGPGAS